VGDVGLTARVEVLVGGVLVVWTAGVSGWAGVGALLRQRRGCARGKCGAIFGAALYGAFRMHLL
jgi:hypothetical protein